MNTYGDKGHIQQSWIKDSFKTYLDEHDISNYILQLNFQLVRGADISSIKYHWNCLLNILFKNEKKYLDTITLICKLVLYTRDIHFGKGERKLSYVLLFELYKINSEVAIMVFENFVKKQPNKTSIGSWKDVKHLADYIYKETDNENHYFILYLIELSNIYLKADYKQIKTIYDLFKDKDEEKIKKYIIDTVDLSLVAKWLPRKSLNNKKYAWLFNKLADSMFKEYFKTIYKNKGKPDFKKLRKAINKSEMNYRKMLSFVNKHLNVVETLQTSHKTDEIDFVKLPSISRERYHKSFLKPTSNQICRNKYKKYITSRKYIDTHKNLYELIRNIIVNKLWLRKPSDLDRIMINKLWKSKKMNIEDMENIPLVDVSQSMNGIPLYNSIALGIFISEHNKHHFKNKLITFGSQPRWINFDDKMDICDKVNHIITNNVNIKSDLYSVFNMFIEIIKKYKLSREELKPYTVTILSDMQVEDNIDIRNPCIYSNIKMMFNVEDIEMPQIIFWNLKFCNGFPISTIHNYTDIVMLSGFNEKILSIFNNKRPFKKEKLGYKDDRNILFEILNNKRYDFVNGEILKIILL